jgi:hypothetical protein
MGEWENGNTSVNVKGATSRAAGLINAVTVFVTYTVPYILYRYSSTITVNVEVAGSTKLTDRALEIEMHQCLTAVGYPSLGT